MCRWEMPNYFVSRQPSALLLKGGQWCATHSGVAFCQIFCQFLHCSPLVANHHWGPPNSGSSWRLSKLIHTVFLLPYGQTGWGPVNLSPDLAVGATWFSNLAGLAAQVVRRSFWVSVSSLAEGTVVWSASGVSVGPGWVSLASYIAGGAVESAGEAPHPWSQPQIVPGQ